MGEVNRTDNNGNANGRDDFGRFASGNRAAAGNPVNRRMRELRQKLLDCATEGDIEELYKSLMISARSGDTGAARVLLEYLLGKPTQAVEISGPDGRTLDVGLVAGIVLEVVGDDPAVRYRVASAFAALGRQQREATGDGMA